MRKNYKKFCNQCNRTTKFKRTQTGVTWDPINFRLIFISVITLGLGFLLIYLPNARTRFFNEFCTECNMGRKGVGYGGFFNW